MINEELANEITRRICDEFGGEENWGHEDGVLDILLDFEAGVIAAIKKEDN